MVKIKLRVRMDRKIKILILEDSETIRNTEKKILRALGFTGPITECETIAEANKSISNGRYDFFILDWNLPDGIGLNFLKTIRKIEKYKDVPVMMVTTESDVANMLQAIEEGASNYATKPIEIEDFVEKFQVSYEKHYGSLKKSEPTKTRNISRKMVDQTQGKEAIQQSSSPKDIKFLCIDDSQTSLHAIENALKSLGYKGEIFKANSVVEAKKLLKSKPVSMILCDWNMPGESGIDLLNYLQNDQRYKKLPFVMVTANSESHQILAAIESGATDYLTKPWTPEQLREKIDSSWSKFNAKVYSVGRKKK